LASYHHSHQQIAMPFTSRVAAQRSHSGYQYPRKTHCFGANFEFDDVDRTGLFLSSKFEGIVPVGPFVSPPLMNAR
jgi:hypothetical protein